ncbi:MAG: hypothetical protein V4772_22115 [Pseudomonadota bacterium]
MACSRPPTLRAAGRAYKRTPPDGLADYKGLPSYLLIDWLAVAHF